MKETTLNPQDAAALDAFMASRCAAGGTRLHVAYDDPARVQRVEGVLSLLDAWPAEEPSIDLVDRTLAHVAEARQRGRFANQIAELAAVPRHRFGWYEFGAVAAALIIMTSLALPMFWEDSQPQSPQAAGIGTGVSEAVKPGPSTYVPDLQIAPAGESSPRSLNWLNVPWMEMPAQPEHRQQQIYNVTPRQGQYVIYFRLVLPNGADGQPSIRILDPNAAKFFAEQAPAEEGR